MDGWRARVRIPSNLTPFLYELGEEIEGETMSEASEFKTGYIVYLASGGPEMVVTSEKRGDNLVTCQWFVDGELHTEPFDPQCLAFHEVAEQAGSKAA